MIPGISGGSGGGVDLSGGPSTAESAADNDSTGAVFNFAPPQSVQRVQAYSGMMPWLALVVAAVLYFALKK